MSSFLLVLLVGALLKVVSSKNHSSLVSSALFHAEVTDSGIEEVERYATVIIFYIEIKTKTDNKYNLTIAPGECCLNIEEGDSDCGGIIDLRPPVNLIIEPAQKAGRAEFLFRNLYVRYRKGNCTFAIYSREQPRWKFKHTVYFNTYPEAFDDTTIVCPGIDQDPDRSCSPVDCAIKYHGKRNYYRSNAMKCEKVVECDTRGEDGVSIVAYYDWDNNLCLPLENVLNDEVQLDEKDTVIPAELDPSQNSIFPDFEANQLQQLVSDGKYDLKCNHGVQKGAMCECDDGWVSSGVHESNLLEFKWCDRKRVDTSTIQMAPRKLSKPIEIVLIVILSVVNVGMFLTWIYIAFKVLHSTLTAALDYTNSGDSL